MPRISATKEHVAPIVWACRSIRNRSSRQGPDPPTCRRARSGAFMLSVSQGTSAMLGFLRWSRVVLAIQFGSCYRPFPLIRRARPRMVISSKLLHATLYCKLCSDSPDKGVRASWTVFISVSEMPAALLSINVLWRRQESNLRHSACKADALPTELRPLMSGKCVLTGAFALFRADLVLRPYQLEGASGWFTTLLGYLTASLH